MNINAPVNESGSGTGFTKTGRGTLLHPHANFNPSGTIWIKEGLFLRNGNATPSFKGDVVVGGGAFPAKLVIGASCHNNTLAAAKNLAILPGGSLVFEKSAAISSLNQLVITNGFLDCFGGTCGQPMTSTEEIKFSFKGATVTNATISVWGGTLEVLAAEKPSVLYGSLAYTAEKDQAVENGAAPVDLLVDGDFSAASRGVNYAGPGTMVLRVGDHVSMWGGAAGRAFNVYAGEFFFESSESAGIGMGTNNVVVAAGATYGAVGRHVGAEVPLRGRWGNVSVNGAAGNPAIFAIGRKEIATGALLPGTYTMGSAEQTNDVTLAANSVLQIAADRTSFSKLVVNGTLTIADNDTLAITGPADAAALPYGEHVIVETREAMSRQFANVTYNGSPLSVAQGRVVQESNRIVFNRKRRHTIIVVH